MARASIARRFGNGARVIMRTWKAIKPISSTSPMTSNVTEVPVEEWSKGSR